MKFVFLILALAPLLLPVIFQIDKQIFKDGNLRAAFGASLVSTILFSAITVVLYLLGLISYNAQNTLSISFKDIPVEQYLLHFSLNFTAISLYQYLNLRFPKNDLQKYSLAFSNLLLGLCVAFLFFGYPKWYTMLTFATLLLVLLLIEYVGKIRFMYRAYRAFVFMLVPLLIVYSVLAWNNVVTATANGVSGLHIAKVPVETLCMFLSALLVSIYMFEFFKSKRAA